MLAKRTTWLWLIPALLLATWIGARGLNADALWFDEYWSIYNAGGAHYGPLSPADIWGRVSAQDPWQAPGYFLLLAGWGALVGWTPFALRALSLLAGALAVAWAYRLGRDAVSPLGGLTAAVTMGMSAYFLYFFHEMRTYTLIVMLITMTAWAYWRVMNGARQPWIQAILLLGAVGLFYTHYFAALTVGVFGLYHLLFVKKDRRWWRAALPLVGAGLLFLPWLGTLVSGLNSATEDALRQANAWTPRQVVSGVLFMFSNGGVLLALLLGFLSFRRQALFAWFWLLAMLGLLLLINARFGVILEVRYLFPLWPALALLAALAIDRLSMSGLRSAALAVLALWTAAGVWNSLDSDSAYTLSNPHWHQPWNVLVEQLRPRGKDGDALLYLLPDWTWPGYHQKVFDYYLYGSPVRGGLIQRPENTGAAAFAQSVKDEAGGASRLWLAYTADQPTTYLPDAQKVLSEAGYLDCGGFNASPPLGLELYRHKSAAPPLATFGGPTLDSRIVLAALDAAPLSDKTRLNVTAVWSQGKDVPPNTFSVALHLEDAAGHLVAQADYGFPAEESACRSLDIPLKDMAPGEYRLYAAVYRWQSGERLAAATADGVTGDRAPVARIQLP
jgi:hypothetical protein